MQIASVNGKLTGDKLFVTDAIIADFIIVVARDGIFVVDAKAPGLSVQRMDAKDLTRKVYSVRFNGTPAERRAIAPAWRGRSMLLRRLW